MRFCEQCGAPLKEGARFCENCGAQVAAEQEVFPEESNSSKTTEVADSGISNNQNEQQIEAEKSESEPSQALDKTAEQIETPDFEEVSSEENPASKDQQEGIRPTTLSESKETAEYHTNKPKKQKKQAYYVLAGIALIVLFVGGFFWFNNQKTRNKATVATELSSTSTDPASSTTVQSSEITASTTETEVISETNFDVAKAETITESALKNATGNFSIVLSPVINEESAYKKAENQTIRSASVIKLFIMAAIFDRVNRGRMDLTQEYTLSKEETVGGTGVLQNYPEGMVLTFDQLLYHMIVDSDNTAGNILVQNLGGFSGVNDYARKNGFSGTSMNRLFLDTEALSLGRDNYTTAEDVAKLLTNIYQHQQVSEEYDQEMLNLLFQNKNHDKLPAEVGSEVSVYNKTGEFADYGVENDACIFEKNGEAYVLVVLSDNGKSNEQIAAMKQLGKTFYETFMR